MNIELQEMLKVIIAEAITPITKDIAEMKVDIKGMKEDINSMKEDINGLKVEVSGMKEDINGLKVEVSGMKEDINGLKVEVSGINTRLTAIESKVTSIDSKVISIESKQDIIFIQTGKLSEFQAETVAVLSQLATKDDLDYFDAKASRNEREIFKLKKRA